MGQKVMPFGTNTDDVLARCGSLNARSTVDFNHVILAGL